MIKKMLADIAEQGYSSKDVKETVIQVLRPFFDNDNSLNQYACYGTIDSRIEQFFNEKRENKVV